MNYYFPKAYQKDILSIDYSKLNSLGIKVIIYDFDNTIIEKGKYEVSKEIINLFSNLKKDFNVIILSNTLNKDKISLVSNQLEIDYIKFALKPLPFGFYKVKNKYNVNYNEICLVGDQLLTDIKGANRLGVYSVLVDPIDKNESFFTKLNRTRECSLIQKMNKKYSFKRGKYYE